MKRRDFLSGATALGVGAFVAPDYVSAQGRLVRALEDIEGDAEGELAYIVGMEAYVFGFPLVLMDATNRVVTAVPTAGEYYAPMNQFLKMRGYVDPNYQVVVRISVNSVWSAAVLDLGPEPVVVSYPSPQGRYWVLQLLNMWTDDFASVGTRTTGDSGGVFVVAGPNWSGRPPEGVSTVYRCTTRYAWCLIQHSAASPQDFPAIHALQDQLKITPLSAWGTNYEPPKRVPVDPTVDTTYTPYEHVRQMTGEMFFAHLARLLAENPAYPADARMLQMLKRIGVEPGKPFDRTSVSPAIMRGLNRAPPQVWLKFETGPYSAPSVNGWQNILNIGRFGTDYATRAFVAWFGLGALTKEDCVYPSAFLDGDGQVLDGRKNYVMRFERDQMLPSLSSVWSVSPYRGNFYVPNAINRYGLTSKMPLKYDPDGSLTLYIQAQSPGSAREANWLPCPPSGPFNLSIRVYHPGPSLLDGTYKIPPVKQVQ
ncbi:MAG: DUF1254 domain-containing protein [Burkholderiales bacterium]